HIHIRYLEIAQNRFSGELISPHYRLGIAHFAAIWNHQQERDIPQLVQTGQRPRRNQKTGSRYHQCRRLSTEKCSRADSHSDALVADRDKCKASIRRDALLHPIKSVVRQHCNQIDAGRLETSDNGFTCFSFHNNRSLSRVLQHHFWTSLGILSVRLSLQLALNFLQKTEVKNLG